MGLLTLEAIGPNGEQLAMAAGKKRDIPVGWDAEFACATFDADGVDDDELQTIVFEELADIDPDWRSQLKVAE
jgi:hypothetical protein